jgi:hypothetical protein
LGAKGDKMTNKAQQKVKYTRQASATTQQQSQRANNGQCPNCGSERIQAVYSTTNKGFSDAKACSGCCLFGPIGLLCGMCGSGKKQEHSHRMCLNCGCRF